jgi:hypothetical protein
MKPDQDFKRCTPYQGIPSSNATMFTQRHFSATHSQWNILVRRLAAGEGVLERRVEDIQDHAGHEHVDYTTCRNCCLAVLSYGTLAVRDASTVWPTLQL